MCSEESCQRCEGSGEDFGAWEGYWDGGVSASGRGGASRASYADVVTTARSLASLIGREGGELMQN